jgi:hypothetical protein
MPLCKYHGEWGNERGILNVAEWQKYGKNVMLPKIET